LTKPEIEALSIDERLALIDDLWDSVDDTLDALAPPAWHLDVLDEILDEEERDPQPTVSWEEVRTELVEKWVRERFGSSREPAPTSKRLLPFMPRRATGDSLLDFFVLWTRRWNVWRLFRKAVPSSTEIHGASS